LQEAFKLPQEAFKQQGRFDASEAFCLYAKLKISL